LKAQVSRLQDTTKRTQISAVQCQGCFRFQFYLFCVDKRELFYRFIVSLVCQLVLFQVVMSQSGDGEIMCELHKRNDFECIERIKEFKQCKTIFCTFPAETLISEPGIVLGNQKNKRVKLLYFSSVKGINFLPDRISAVFPDLEEIDGYNSSLMELSYRNLLHLYDVEKINLGMNQLKAIREDTFGDLVYLKVLNLGSNKIKNLHPEVFAYNQNLERLNLDDNQLEFLDPKLFKNNNELVVLILSNNHLKSIEPATFNPLPMLEQLSLGNNRISILPALTFKNNRKLLTLWLNHNKITRIDQILLENLTSLETVGFSDNPLEMVDLKIFEFNKNIRNIYFYKCSIRYIKNIRKVSSLKKLQTANFQENFCIDKEYTTTCVIELRQDLLRSCEFW
jgi:hypothetical protein